MLNMMYKNKCTYGEDHIDHTLEDACDRITRQEYGGCHPGKDDVCKLKARVVHRSPYHCIEVFVVGKWRAVRGYAGHKQVVTNKKILADMERTVRINTGSYDDHNFPYRYNPSKGTFADKTIEFVWVQDDETK